MPTTVGGALFSSKPNEAKRQATADSDSEDERIMNAAKAAKVAKAPEGDKPKKQRKPDERTSLGKAKAQAIRSKEAERAEERAMSSSDDDEPAPPKPAVAAAVATITAAASAAAAKPKPSAERKPAAPRANGKAKAGGPAALSPETLALQAELTVLRDENERLTAEAAGLKNYKARARLVAAQTPGLGAAAWDKMMAESAPSKQQPPARNGAPVESPPLSEDDSEDPKAKSGAAAPKGNKGPKKTIAKKTKGPRQARNYYISAIWSKMKALPGTDADQLMRQGNLRWKALSAEEAKPYHAMARNDKKRTLREKNLAYVSDDEEVPEVDEPPFPEIEMPDASAGASAGASDDDAAPEAAAAAGLDYAAAPPEDPDSE
jgi:hypothetical protein